MEQRITHYLQGEAASGAVSTALLPVPVMGGR
jgi:hypothetical protein